MIVLFLGITACMTAVRVLKDWDPASDSNRQIRLENETWLASTLVEYGLGFQIITLVLCKITNLYIVAIFQFS